MEDEFNSGKCNGCKWHKKDTEETFWRYLDGSPRNDLCSHPDAMKDYGGEPVPVFNIGCRQFEVSE